ncbi:unnamed protein product [Spodoptera littoralis]|uniref:FLYWCH-type domain-containing protein n=1 Tax=Spodoptera littoralis TaxID=7109 RepID=A0A9P0HY09_SPOLI|nr:unnamed protein product [Spodoptera littoralis]CAH1635564.1 unnamed protein product [Spodoptera littoralis]
MSSAETRGGVTKRIGCAIARTLAVRRLFSLLTTASSPLKEIILIIEIHHIISGPVMIPTRRGGMKLLFGDEIFFKNKTAGASSYWVCKRKVFGCRATIQTYGDMIVKVKGVHSHH